MQKTLARMGRFFREVRAELGKVIWPGRRAVGVYTAVVLATIVVVASIIWVSDVVVGQLIALMLR